MRLTRLAGLTATGALLLALAAPASAASGDAMVRVLHGSPDAPSVDVFVDGSKVDALSGIVFGDLTDYVAVPAGTYAVKVCATADSTVCPIDVPALDLAADTDYTIAASNVLASIEAKVLVDDPALVADKALVRVVHLSADTPAVDVLTQDGSATVVDNLAYPDATGYLALDGGSYDLKVCADADNTVCPLDPGALDLADGTAYSVFAVGALTPAEGAQGLTAVVGVDGTYQAPSATPPPTDTAGTSTTSGGALALTLAVLAAAGILGAGLALRVAPARARR